MIIFLKRPVFIITIILVFGLLVSLDSLLAGWQGPFISPPQLISAPIDVSGDPHEKKGSLGIEGNLLVGTPSNIALFASSSANKVAIGTSSVASNLTLGVAGKVGANKYCDIEGVNCIGTDEIIVGWDSYSLDSHNGDPDLLYVDENGNIGLSTSEPSSHRLPDADDLVMVASNGELFIIGEDIATFLFKNTVDGSQNFRLRNDKGIFRIDASSDLVSFENLIKIDNKASPTTVEGSIFEINGMLENHINWPQIQFIKGASNLWKTSVSTDHFSLQRNSESPMVMRLFSEKDGNPPGLAINSNTLQADYAVYVNGSVNVSGTKYCTSDINLKKNINSISSSLDMLQDINGVYYEWKDPDKGSGKKIGVIAQEVEKVFPEVVGGKGDESRAVNYGGLSALIINAINEARESLNERLEKQEKINSDLKNIICETDNSFDFCKSL